MIIGGTEWYTWEQVWGNSNGGGNIPGTGIVPVQNLRMWLDATNPLNTGVLPANGALVPNWYDKSGNGNNAIFTKNSGVNNFYTNQINGLPVLSNDGRSGVTQFYSLAPNLMLQASGFSLYAVYQCEAEIQPGAALISIGTSISNYIEVSPTGAGGQGRQLFAATTVNATSASFYSSVPAQLTVPTIDNYNLSPVEADWNLGVDGIDVSITKATGGGVLYPSNLQFTSTNNYLCKSNLSGVNNLTVNFGEILLYGVWHTPAQRQQVQNYLINKWGFASGMGAFRLTGGPDSFFF